MCLNADTWDNSIAADVMLNVNHFVILCAFVLSVMGGVMAIGIMTFCTMQLSTIVSINDTKASCYAVCQLFCYTVCPYADCHGWHHATRHNNNIHHNALQSTISINNTQSIMLC